MRNALPRLWRIGAKVAAAALLVLAARLASALPELWPAGVEDYREIAWLAVGAALLILLIAAVMWLAYRLWSRWNTLTVRWAVGILLACAAIALAGQMTSRMHGYVEPLTVLRLSAVIHLVLLIAAVLAYRWLVPWVIRSAQLVEPLDQTLQPRGHSERVRFFATMLGFAVWLASSAVLEPLIGPGVGWHVAIALFLPVLIGILTYKLVLWRMLPRTHEALPAGGFEVQTAGRREP